MGKGLALAAAVAHVGGEPAVLLGGHELRIVVDAGALDGHSAVGRVERQVAPGIEGRHRVVEGEEGGHVDRVALAVTEVLEDDRSGDVSVDVEAVGALAAPGRVAAVDGEPVVAIVAVEQVAALATDDHVVAGTTLDHVVTVVTAEVAVASPVGDLVVATTTEQVVVAGVAGGDTEDVVTETGADRCPASLGADLDGVVASGLLVVEVVVAEDELVVQQSVHVAVCDVEDMVSAVGVDGLLPAAVDVDLPVPFAARTDAIVAGAGVDGVVDVADVERVVARAALHGGVSEVLDEDIVARAAVQDVVVLQVGVAVARADEPVGAGAAVHDAGAEDGVVAGIAVQDVESTPSLDDVVAGAAVDGLLARGATDDVGLGRAIDGRAVAGDVHGIVSRCQKAVRKILKHC